MRTQSKPITSAPGAPSKIAIALRQGKTTGQWMTMTKINNSTEVCISTHLRKADARAAACQIAQVFAQIPLDEWKNPKTFELAVRSLQFRDKPELLLEVE